ncbi:hypothetical protein LguiB_028537 [Lonicera macranthoides]
MGGDSLSNPKTWVPYMNPKDCSQGFCSLYCPQWCYIVFPPPPSFQFPAENSNPRFSPLVIAIIGILASSFVLVSYYALISNFCRKRGSSRRTENHDPGVEMEENNLDHPNHETWYFATNGLDESVVKSIAVCKYKKGDGLVEGTECSVCLNEFQEDESLRILPKCTHAFHINCIDTWLSSHSNCPLCRANIGFVNSLPVLLPPIEIESESLSRRDQENDNHEALEARETRNLMGDVMIEIREEGARRVRRSLSMDNMGQTRVSILDILGINEDKEVQIDGVGSSKGEMSSHKYKALHCVMKRSFSSGRFLFTRVGRG